MGADADHGPDKTTIIRDGRVIGTKPVGFVVARERPGRWLVSSAAPVCNGFNGSRVYRLSPDGAHVLCYDGENIRLFERRHPKSARVVISNDIAAGHFAWLDDSRFAALVLDKSCPRANLYDDFPTRVETFDLSGRRISSGPCAFGVVAGGGRMALMGERANSALWRLKQLFADDPRYYNDGYDRFHHTWSVDNGKTWHDGVPLAFDGNGRLLYVQPFGDDIESEDGQTAFKHAYDVDWSR